MTHQLVEVHISNHETWSVPKGFGVHYRRAARDLSSAQVLRDLLELVGWTADLDTISTWPKQARVEAEVYAVRVHLRAGDNIVTVPPRPRWFPEPWKGPRSTVTSPMPTLLVGPEARPSKPTKRRPK